MPATDIKYENTVIYIIQHRTQDELLYIGHTTDLKARKCHHKRNTKVGDTRKLYTMIRENGGWDEFEMRPIKTVSCTNSTEARIEEEKCRVEYKAKMNTYKAYRTAEEKKESKKEWREQNKDYLKEKNKEYYEKNNNDYLKEKKKEYYEKNKEAINKQRFRVCLCTCGKEYTRSNKSQHEKTKYHIENSV